MTTKPKKVVKKLIRVKGHPWELQNPYKCSQLGFAFANKNGSERRQCNKIVFCRDYFLDIVAENRTGKDVGNTRSYMNINEHPKIDFDTLRLLLIRDPADVDEFKIRLFSAKRALNYYEELAGFKERSTITTVKHEYKSNVWLLTGPSEWLLFPTLISMAVLVLRVISKYGPVSADKTPDDLMMDLVEAYKHGSDKAEWGKVSHVGDVSNYLTKTADKFGFMMENWKEIFGEITKDNFNAVWSGDDSHGFYTQAGFVNICDWAQNGRNGGTNITNKYYKGMIDRFGALLKKRKKN